MFVVFTTQIYRQRVLTSCRLKEFINYKALAEWCSGNNVGQESGD